MTKFRISAHSLRIQTGRYERKPNKGNKLIKIVREERTSLYCNNNDVEDEMHFLLKCPLYGSFSDNFWNSDSGDDCRKEELNLQK